MSAFWHCVNMKPRWWLSPYMTKYIAYREEDREIPEESWKKKLYLIIMVLSSIWPQVSTRNFLLVFWAFVFRNTRNNKLFIIRALLHDRGRYELLRHHKFQHLLKIFLKLPALSPKHFPNLLNNFNNTAHHTHKRTHAPIARFKREKNYRRYAVVGVAVDWGHIVSFLESTFYL